MAIGDIVGGVLAERVSRATADARNAAALALAAYLQKQQFLVYSPDGAVRTFALTEVFHEWPDPDRDLPYPCASIVEVTDATMAGHSFQATPLEDTFGRYGKDTVLWKVDELEVEFQLDGWFNDAPAREAFMARLPGLFAPDERTSRLLLEGPTEYFCWPVRFTLESFRRQDAPEAQFSHERRVIARVRSEVDVLELRCATLLDVATRLDVTDPADPQEEPPP